MHLVSQKFMITEETLHFLSGGYMYFVSKVRLKKITCMYFQPIAKHWFYSILILFKCTRHSYAEWL